MGGNEHANDIVGKEVVRGLYVPSGRVPVKEYAAGMCSSKNAFRTSTVAFLERMILIVLALCKRRLFLRWGC